MGERIPDQKQIAYNNDMQLFTYKMKHEINSLLKTNRERSVLISN